MSLAQIITTFLLLFSLSVSAQNFILSGNIQSEAQQNIPNVEIFLVEKELTVRSDNQGNFRFESLSQGSYTLVTFLENYASITEVVTLSNPSTSVSIVLQAFNQSIETIEITDTRAKAFVLQRLNDIQGTAIYASKKTEVITIDNINVNLATNSARQIYATVPGLNIWESDGGGLQLSIGARGLDPNRTSNFNTRQNGYDISADALGYPESYYTPSGEAIQQIEIVRGAASLQYGPQFGGLLNFKMKDGNIPEKLKVSLGATLGFFGFLNGHLSAEGKIKKVNYFGFYQKKQGDGWRENSQFDQNTFYGSVTYKPNNKLRLQADLTHMDYLAQQAGGLTDLEFNTDPQQSKRARNWFKINWNLLGLNLDYQVNSTTKINSRAFLLDAGREALGNLKQINRVDDPLIDRDLVKGKYNNWGIESRLLKRYTIGENLNNFLVGIRYYKGSTQNQQGFGDNSAEAVFDFLSPDAPSVSDISFPSENVSIFIENLFRLSPKWSISPGLRWEYLSTNSKGYFQNILTGIVNQAQNNDRNFLLLGLGSSYRFGPSLELYFNASQNYRSVNFSDLAVSNPNQVVDLNLKDESGFNLDLGFRGSLEKSDFIFDLSLFYLQYKDRIGASEVEVIDTVLGIPVPKFFNYRSNIGDAQIYGLESYVAKQFHLATFGEKDLKAKLFLNAAFIQSKYTSGASNFLGKQVELVPPFNLKTGLHLSFHKIRLSYQYAYTRVHFTDATNAVSFPDATRGLIPSYGIHDLNASYTYRNLRFKASISNLTDARYFTRRAVAYPGPGIIPADARAVYFGVNWHFNVK